MQSHLDEIRRAGAEVLAISVDPVTINRKLAADLGLAYDLLSDTKLTVIDAYGVRHRGAGIDGQDIARPATFIIDRHGVISWRSLTNNWRIRVRPERILDELAKIP